MISNIFYINKLDLMELRLNERQIQALEIIVMKVLVF